MAYPTHVREFAQQLILRGYTQADAIRMTAEEFAERIPDFQPPSKSCMKKWADAVLLDEDAQIKAAQYRQDAADRAAIRAGTASALLQQRLDAMLEDSDRFDDAIAQIVDWDKHGLVDPDEAAEAVEVIRSLTTIATRDLSAIIKDAAAQQVQLSVSASAPAAVQICFGDQLEEAADG